MVKLSKIIEISDSLYSIDNNAVMDEFDARVLQLFIDYWCLNLFKAICEVEPASYKPRHSLVYKIYNEYEPYDFRVVLTSGIGCVTISCNTTAGRQYLLIPREFIDAYINGNLSQVAKRYYSGVSERGEIESFITELHNNIRRLKDNITDVMLLPDDICNLMLTDYWKIANIK